MKGRRGPDLPTIAMISDFGTWDAYTGIMKGVISSIAPSARIIDLSHEVQPGDVRSAAFMLWQAAPFMPRGTIFLAVVDPDVGTERRAIAVSFSRFTFVGPDNGLFTYLSLRDAEYRGVRIASTEPGLPGAGSTFHGRDVFAPAAAHLAAGLPITALGVEVEGFARLPLPRLESLPEGRLRGEVLRADRFGNLVTSIGFLRTREDSIHYESWLAPRKRYSASRTQYPASRDAEYSFKTAASLRARLSGGAEIPFRRTYGEVPPGEPLAYIGSDGLLEIAVNKGNAAAELSVFMGMEVSLH